MQGVASASMLLSGRGIEQRIPSWRWSLRHLVLLLLLLSSMQARREDRRYKRPDVLVLQGNRIFDWSPKMNEVGQYNTNTHKREEQENREAERWYIWCHRVTIGSRAKLCGREESSEKAKWCTCRCPTETHGAKGSRSTALTITAMVMVKAQSSKLEARRVRARLCVRREGMAKYRRLRCVAARVQALLNTFRPGAARSRPRPKADGQSRKHRARDGISSAPQCAPFMSAQSLEMVMTCIQRAHPLRWAPWCGYVHPRSGRATQGHPARV